MKVKRIDLDDEEMPERVLVELSHDEAVYLGLMIGRQSSNAMNEVMPGGVVHGERGVRGPGWRTVQPVLRRRRPGRS